MFPISINKNIFIGLTAVLLLSAVFHFLGIYNLLPWSIVYSDIVAFFDKAAAPGFPYIDKLIEYPVLTGLLIQLAGYLGVTKVGYFIVSALFLMLAALVSTIFLLRIISFPTFQRSETVIASSPSLRASQRRAKQSHLNIFIHWIFAPSMLLFGIFNWDLLAVFFVILAFYLFQKEKYNWSAVSLAAGFSAKFFPIIYLPLLLWKIEGWGRRSKALIAFLVSAFFVNIFFIIKNLNGWYYFFALNTSRNSNFDSIWTLARFIFPSLEVDHINFLSPVFFALAYIIILWKLRKEHFFKLCFAVTLAFLFFNKVFSPQYVLWLLPFFVLISPSSKEGEASPAYRGARWGISSCFPPPSKGGGPRWGIIYLFYLLELSNLISFFISLQWFFSVARAPIYFYIDIPFIIIRYGALAYLFVTTLRSTSLSLRDSQRKGL